MILSSKTNNRPEKGMNMKANYSLTAVACAFLLAACGGGGGGNGASTAPVTPVTPPVVTPPASDIQTSVAAPTYAAGSQELAFFTIFNDFRSKLGLGLVAQNTKLDAADQNHMKYLMTNTDVDFSAVDPKTGRPYFHLEDPARPNYTGVTELDRAKFTQYPGVYVGEFGAYGKGQGAAVAITDLIATVYHRSGLMFQFPREVGIAVSNDPNQTIVVTLGYQTTMQYNASNFFGTYPADKQTNVPRVAYIETPNPFPDVAYADFNTKTSFPINVVSEASTTLAVTSFTVTEAGQTAAHDSRLLTKDTDPNKQLAANTAYLVGKSPFKANTTYNVSFTGTVNGAAVAKTWSFTTGS
jgi:uncharacterized protein YkwD